MSGGRGVKGGRVLSLVLVLVLVAGVVPGPESASRDWSVELLRDGFGHSFMIHGYALADAEDYHLVHVRTPCQCRRWCQVSTMCHSASAVVVAGGGVECRASQRPHDLQDIKDRPRLNKTQGAFHFLSVASTDSDDEGHYKNYHWTSTWHPWTRPPMGCTMAVLTSKAEVLALLKVLPANTPFHVNLSLDGKSVLSWDPDGASLPYAATDHGPTHLDDSFSISNFYLTHDGKGNYVFVGGKNMDRQRTLCQNALNLID